MPAPLLNQYKLKFSLRRWVQTWLGGLFVVGLKSADGDRAPVYAYITQIVLFFIPLLFCLPLSLVAGLLPHSVGLEVGIYAAAGVVGLAFVLVLRIVSRHIVETTVSEVGDVEEMQLDDEETFRFESCASPGSCAFYVPNNSILVIIEAAFLAVLMFAGATHFMNPDNFLNRSYN